MSFRTAMRMLPLIKWTKYPFSHPSIARKWPTDTTGNASRGRMMFFRLVGLINVFLTIMLFLTSCNDKEPITKQLIFVLVDKTEKPNSQDVYVQSLHKVQDVMGLGWYRENEVGIGPLEGSGHVIIASFKDSTQGIVRKVDIKINEPHFNDNPIRRRRILRTTYDELNKGFETVLDSPYGSSQTPILQVLQQTSEILKAEKAQKKTLYVLSNMHENSGILSFYGKSVQQNVLSDPKGLLDKKKSEIPSADFKGVDIYVVAPDSQNRMGYDLARKIEEFWRRYFNETQAKSVKYIHGLTEALD